MSSGFFIVGSAILLATTVHHSWSWPFFVWGASIGPLASAYAYLSTQAFGRMLTRRDPGNGARVATRQRGLWERYRWVYSGMVLFGVAIGILSGGLDSPGPDIAFTILWVLTGVLLPLIGLRLILKRLDHRLMQTPPFA